MFYDIHSHILPGIDDGAQDMQASLDMLAMAASSGTGCIFATPHYIHGSINNNTQNIQDKYEELLAAARETGLKDIRILYGSELFLCPELPELVKDGMVNTLNGASYVLVEFPMNIIPVYTDEVLYRLRLYGFTPIIAHPERNTEIQANPEVLLNMIKTGALSQVNATSITGVYGKGIQKFAFKLISHNLVHFAASDSHTCRGRSPKLEKAFDEVSKKVGAGTAERLFITNGKAVAENKEVFADEPLSFKKKSFLSLLSRF